MSLVSHLTGLLRRHRDAALALGVAGMAAVIVVSLVWSGERHQWRPAVDCERAPALSSEPRAMYLVRLSPAASPEDACKELQAELDRLRALRQTPSESRSAP